MAITLNLRPTAIIFPSSNPPSVSSASSVSLKNPSKSAFLSPIPSAIFHHLKPPPTLTRRLLLPSVSGIWDALTGGSNNAREAVLSIRRGMLLFRQGDVSGSLAEFDKAIALDPRQKAYLWQRGLSLYYLDRFEEGAEQFRLDVAQNPNDTEESIWCFLCEAQLYGVDEARKRFLEVGSDRRPVMRAAYNMFKDGGDPEKVCFALMLFDSRWNTYMLWLHFPKAEKMSLFMLHYMLGFITNLRYSGNSLNFPVFFFPTILICL
ncbi:uncharacterized protein LOC129320669 isoform X4 [Prosopis cineraria]|uniref:uncharacterized protein LOC129320669 isoform X4 n=1 Tax=Prosopis cineraria TaxID=364024 RepID=UPI00240EC244|nr:uncharacterized protein LOC129320669 isoform X4 [Prosopis cineraria]